MYRIGVTHGLFRKLSDRRSGRAEKFQKNHQEIDPQWRVTFIKMPVLLSV